MTWMGWKTGWYSGIPSLFCGHAEEITGKPINRVDRKLIEEGRQP